MFCGGFAAFFKIIAPGVGFLRDLSAPGVGVSHFLFARGNSSFQKIPPGLAQRWDGPGLELTDT